MKRVLAGLAILVLTACGGGGGSSAPSAISPTGPGGTAPIQTASVQRSLVQQTLTSVDQSTTIASFGSTSGSGTLGQVRRTLSDMRRTTSLTCIEGTEVAITATGQPNVDDVLFYGFYDAGCSELWYAASGTLTATSSTAGTLAIAYTYYTPAGSVYRYVPATLSLTGVGTGSGTFALLASLSTGPSAPPFANVGLGCSIAANADACSVAEADHLSALDIDEAVAANVSASLSSAAGGSTISLGGNGVADTGAFDATSVVSTGSYTFGISGGTTIDAASLSGSLTLTSAGLVAGGSLSLSDAADGATVSATYNAGSQTIGGAVTLNAGGATLATYTVNLQGSGTVTYSNGSTGTISGWVVQS